MRFAGLIGCLFRGFFLHDWKPSVETGAALVGLLSVLFEAMYDLAFLRDAVEGADFCVGLALEQIPATRDDVARWRRLSAERSQSGRARSGTAFRERDKR